MKKEKYKDLDGSIYEMSFEEYCQFPYNSRLTKIKEEVELKTKTIKKVKKLKHKEDE